MGNPRLEPRFPRETHMRSKILPSPTQAKVTRSISCHATLPSPTHTIFCRQNEIKKNMWHILQFVWPDVMSINKTKKCQCNLKISKFSACNLGKSVCESKMADQKENDNRLQRGVCRQVFDKPLSRVGEVSKRARINCESPSPISKWTNSWFGCLSP